jgi:hypothetical protein
MKPRVALLGCSLLVALPLSLLSISQRSTTATTETTLVISTYQLSSPDDFGMSAGLPIPGETQDEYEARQRADYIASQRADTKLRVLSATRQGQFVSITLEAVTGFGLEVDIRGAEAAKPPNECTQIDRGFRCFTTSRGFETGWTDTPGGISKTFAFETTAPAGKRLLINVDSTSAPYDDILRGELEIDKSNNRASIIL